MVSTVGEPSVVVVSSTLGSVGVAKSVETVGFDDEF